MSSHHSVMILTLEGLDGAGKTTLAHRVAERWWDMGFHPLHLAFPGGFMPMVLDLARSQPIEVKQALYAMEMAQAMVGPISEAILQGRPIVIDRWVYSGYAYGQADGLCPCYAEAFFGLLRLPYELSVYLDIPPEVSLARKGEYDLDYLRAVQGHYLNLPFAHRLDANRPLEEVWADLAELLEARGW